MHRSASSVAREMRFLKSDATYSDYTGGKRPLGRSGQQHNCARSAVKLESEAVDAPGGVP